MMTHFFMVILSMIFIHKGCEKLCCCEIKHF